MVVSVSRVSTSTPLYAVPVPAIRPVHPATTPIKLQSLVSLWPNLIKIFLGSKNRQCEILVQKLQILSSAKILFGDVKNNIKLNTKEAKIQISEQHEFFNVSGSYCGDLKQNFSFLKFGIAHFGADWRRASHHHWIHPRRILTIRSGSVSVRVLHVCTHHGHLLIWILNRQRIRPCSKHHAGLVHRRHHWPIRPIVLIESELIRLSHAVRLRISSVWIQHTPVH
ncbi:hypothetical protein BpHYR1_051549 [Brachionus plicatilis]|uniref:Uncharacterized protein n=1 Tax=Brachionus plicatilis TaxID=10195 RepID=A0A3M7Q179_BRAPC|nr:hypothetical protein BpHYR1_051549 [Brachionus plicatilis]